MRTVTCAGQGDLPDSSGSDFWGSSDDTLRLPMDETDHLGVEEFANHQQLLDEAYEAQASLRNGGIGVAEVST